MSLDMTKIILSGVYGAAVMGGISWLALKFSQGNKKSVKYWSLLIPGYLLGILGWRFLFNS
jgi:hypothetical protein